MKIIKKYGSGKDSSINHNMTNIEQPSQELKLVKNMKGEVLETNID